MAEIPRKNSCRFCLSSGTCIQHSNAQNELLSASSGLGQVEEKQEQKVNDEAHHMGIIPGDLDGSNLQVQQKQETEGVKEDTSEKRGGHSSEHSLFGYSVCYGGPDEYYDCAKEGKELTNKNKTVVRNPEETADPSYPSNPEYATRGDWWKGSLHY